MNLTKTSSIILAAILLSTSCRKTYQCRCTLDSTHIQTVQQISYEVTASNRDKAEAECQSHNREVINKVCTLQ